MWNTVKVKFSISFCSKSRQKQTIKQTRNNITFKNEYNRVDVKIVDSFTALKVKTNKKQYFVNKRNCKETKKLLFTMKNATATETQKVI